MFIRSKMLFILIGDDRTGKTTLQKLLIDKLVFLGLYKKLKTNLVFNILHPEIKRKYNTISFANRSYQEKVKDYESVKKYFENHFNPADIAIISSHLDIDDIREMIYHGKRRFYNVYGVFWSNSIDGNLRNEDIALLDWDEKFIIENPILEDKPQIDRQLNFIAESFVDFLINRTNIS